MWLSFFSIFSTLESGSGNGKEDIEALGDRMEGLTKSGFPPTTMQFLEITTTTSRIMI